MSELRAQPADRRPCLDCGRPTFVCAWCCRRLHSSGKLGESIDGTTDDSYVVCPDCMPHVRALYATAQRKGLL